MDANRFVEKGDTYKGRKIERDKATVTVLILSLKKKKKTREIGHKG